MYKYMTAHQ